MLFIIQQNEVNQMPQGKIPSLQSHLQEHLELIAPDIDTIFIAKHVTEQSRPWIRMSEKHIWLTRHLWHTKTCLCLRSKEENTWENQ